MIRSLFFIAVIAAASPLSACMQGASNGAQAQRPSTLRSCPPGFHAELIASSMGRYKCVPE
jgi:hypothetical protein